MRLPWERAKLGKRTQSGRGARVAQVPAGPRARRFGEGARQEKRMLDIENEPNGGLGQPRGAVAESSWRPWRPGRPRAHGRGVGVQHRVVIGCPKTPAKCCTRGHAHVKLANGTVRVPDCRCVGLFGPFVTSSWFALLPCGPQLRPLSPQTPESQSELAGLRCPFSSRRWYGQAIVCREPELRRR